MKRTILTAAAISVALGSIAIGCLDRKPTPVCPVPIEIASSEVSAGQFDGVDLLVVVDNSGSMAEEQAILSTGFFTLVNSLTKPLLNDPTWTYPAVDNMRVAVVSSDLGLSYGENRETAQSPSGVRSCESLQGDNGNFLLSTELNIDVADNEIKCEAATADGDGGGQCPVEFTCGNFDPATNIGFCLAPGGVRTVACPPMAADPGYASTITGAFNPDLTTQVACMGKQGIEGCGFEQQLEAAVVGLSTHAEFIQDTHLLAVLVVSDEEDCSIQNPALFQTTEWLTPQLQNTACNISPENEANLFPTTRYAEQFKALKGGLGNAVIFAAIVGVPLDADSIEAGQPECEGLGTEVAECLDNTSMIISSQEFTDAATGGTYIHFAPSCVRDNPTSGTRITEARPGRRFVAVAQEFQQNSFVYSICNADWSPAMRSIAEIIAKNISSTCWSKKLEWTQSIKQPTSADGTPCTNCGTAECDVVVRIPLGVNDPQVCPPEYYDDLTSDAEKQAYLDRSVVEPITGTGGQITQYNLFCPLPKLSTPKKCTEARTWVDADIVGWYYCEETSEDFANACGDGKDNDGDGMIDGADDSCTRDGCHLKPVGENCDVNTCSYGVEITQAGKDVSRGKSITVMCLQQFSFADENCQEDSPSSCYDSKDRIDEDGNGIWNCTTGVGENLHSPDPNCCPMVWTSPDNGLTKICEPEINAVIQNCKKGMSTHYSPTGDGVQAPLVLDNTNWQLVPACAEHAALLGCTMPGLQ